jgi:hypothetical protein
VFEEFKLGVHIWTAVLIVGTLWRLLSYHAMASQNPQLQHLGMAMSTQY